MEHSRFDPKNAVTFDLPNGQVRLPSGHAGADTARAVIVPADALGAVATAAGEAAARELGHALGRALGARVKARLDVGTSSLEAALEALACELAVVGLGTLSIERWGRALVLCVDDPPFGLGPAPEALLCAVLATMLRGASGRAIEALPLSRGDGRLRVLVGKEASLARVAGWLADGVAWGDALARLHAPSGAAEVS